MINKLLNIVTLFFKNLKSPDSKQNWKNSEFSEGFSEKIDNSDILYEKEKETYSYPVKVLRITSPYGWRTLRGRRVWHSGVDYSGRDNKTAMAVFCGTISKVLYPDVDYPVRFKWDVRLNKFVEIQNIPVGRAWTPYLVLNSRYDPNVRAIYRHVDSTYVVGTDIDIGQDICDIGNWGYSMGPHLHFEIEIFDGLKWNRVDPVKFLDKKIKKGAQ